MARRKRTGRVKGGSCRIARNQTSIDAVRRCVRGCGSDWFDPGTMNFFATRLTRTVYPDCRGGAYFVTTEQMVDNRPNRPSGRRKASIRYYNPTTCRIETVGKFQQYKKPATARDVAARIARKSCKTRGR